MPKAYEEANDGLGTWVIATMAKMASGQGLVIQHLRRCFNKHWLF